MSHEPPDEASHALEIRPPDGETSDPADPQPATTDAQDPAGEPAAGEQEATAQDDEEDHVERCDDIEVNWPEQLSFMERWLSKERVTAACEKIVSDHGASFGRALLENIPLMMFVFVPLMAFLMKFFYPLTGRYYVEHLLFLVHFHSFFYLLMGMGIILDWTLISGGAAQTLGSLIFAGFAIYIPVYLFRAMRVVYGQGRLATAFKYVLLGIAYLLSLALMLAITVTVTAVTL